jgi:hypothetical protein
MVIFSISFRSRLALACSNVITSAGDPPLALASVFGRSPSLKRTHVGWLLSGALVARMAPPPVVLSKSSRRLASPGSKLPSVTAPLTVVETPRLASKRLLRQAGGEMEASPLASELSLVVTNKQSLRANACSAQPVAARNPIAMPLALLWDQAAASC